MRQSCPGLPYEGPTPRPRPVAPLDQPPGHVSQGQVCQGGQGRRRAGGPRQRRAPDLQRAKGCASDRNADGAPNRIGAEVAHP
eukprot:7074958-Alexandrium_andersonii.AAC.1